MRTLFYRGHSDLNLFAGVEKWHGRAYAGFEGSYGFGRDRISTGWLNASLRELDQQVSQPCEPVPASTRRQLLAPGQVVPVDIPLGPSATFVPGRGTAAAGDRRALALAGQPAHRAVPCRLPQQPQRPLHLALRPAASGPAAHSRHSLTRADPARRQTNRRTDPGHPGRTDHPDQHRATPVRTPPHGRAYRRILHVGTILSVTMCDRDSRHRQSVIPRLRRPPWPPTS